MTEQITIPRETWDALREALVEAANFISPYSIGEQVLEKVDAALTAANAVSHPKPETAPATEGGAITSESAANAVSGLTNRYAVQPQAQGEAIAWEATTPGYIKYVTDKQYRSYSETAKRWYKPYKCSGCHPQATEPAWWPIESAPKDAKILLWGKYWNNADVFQHPMIGMWNPISERWEVNFNAWFGVHPTHWMPLPAQPEAHHGK